MTGRWSKLTSGKTILDVDPIIINLYLEREQISRRTCMYVAAMIFSISFFRTVARSNNLVAPTDDVRVLMCSFVYCTRFRDHA